MNLSFKDIFPSQKPVIECIHLMAFPGSPRFEGKMKKIHDKALQEVEMIGEQGRYYENPD